MEGLEKEEREERKRDDGWTINPRERRSWQICEKHVNDYSG
jgi:hypothetical protein